MRPCLLCPLGPAVDTHCSVRSMQPGSGPGYAHSLICPSGHRWTSGPVGLKGGAGRQRSSREGKNTLHFALPAATNTSSPIGLQLLLLDVILPAEYSLP